MLKNFLSVALGGAVGATLRYGFVLLGALIGASGQLSTFFINIIGSFFLGLLTSLSGSANWMLFAGVGACGAFTTFSTYSVHSVQLLQNGRYCAAALYILGTVTVCFAFAWLGFELGRKF